MTLYVYIVKLLFVSYVQPTKFSQTSPDNFGCIVTPSAMSSECFKYCSFFICRACSAGPFLSSPGSLGSMGD